MGEHLVRPGLLRLRVNLVDEANLDSMFGWGALSNNRARAVTAIRARSEASPALHE
jgi:hypothetical protein